MAVLKYDGEKTFVGAVLGEREANGYNDSDFYALVYDAERDDVYEVEFATTRGGCGKAFGTYVDATPETLDRAEAVFKRNYLGSLTREAEEKAKTAERGKTVTLNRRYNSKKLGKVFAAGTSGAVLWRGEDRYHDPHGRFASKAYRVGVRFDGEAETLFLREDDVTVVGHEAYLPTAAELVEAADRAGTARRREVERLYGARMVKGRERNEAAADVAAPLAPSTEADGPLVALARTLTKGAA